MEPFVFKLKKAIPKSFVLFRQGKPSSRAKVFPTSRVTTSGSEHTIYPVSSNDAARRTDKEGRIEMNHFVVGDKVTLLGISRWPKIYCG